MGLCKHGNIQGEAGASGLCGLCRDEALAPPLPKASSVCPVCGIAVPHAHNYAGLMTLIVKQKNELTAQEAKAQLADEFLEEIKNNWPDWSPMNSPAEIIVDLINERSEKIDERDRARELFEKHLTRVAEFCGDLGEALGKPSEDFVCADLLRIAGDVRVQRDKAQAGEAGLRVERDEARAERDKWKAMAEWQYGVRVYPHNMSLRKGALDAYIKTWSPDAAIEARKEGEA